MDIFNRWLHSLDHAVDGIGHASPKGHYGAPVDGMLGAGPAPREFSIYDAPGQYAYPQQEYEPPAPWSEETPVPDTPPLRTDPPVFPEPLRVEYPAMTEELMTRLLGEVNWAAVEQAPAPLWPSGDGREGIGLRDAACDVLPPSDLSDLPVSLFDAPPRGQVDSVEVMADDRQREDGGDLEALMQRARPIPEETLEEQEDPWELYRQQMMDPGMMGFGPDPGR